MAGYNDELLSGITQWRCISPGDGLERANILHGGMPCAQETEDTLNGEPQPLPPY